ncbi:hypothetical protein [Acidithiobacillus sp.]|jgi:hypothetical protein|nr:hypothetical protein [Acidithiobacillus sp.]MDD5280163.1 hypothetical protein [Acidithiobacillus sp.]
MAQTLWITHNKMLEQLFTALDRRIGGLHGASYQSGFWRSGLTGSLMPDVTEAALKVRSRGFWKASATFASPAASDEPEKQASLRVDLLALVLGGNARVGLYLPDSLLEAGIRDMVSRLYDGKPAPIERRIGGDTFFDWIFTGDPFSAAWMLRCTQDQMAYDILENHFLWAVIHIWEGLSRTLMTNHGVVFPIVADRFLSPELAEGLGLAIVEHMERPREDGGTEKVTLVTSDTGYPDDAIQEALRAVIPHCRFFY